MGNKITLAAYTWVWEHRILSILAAIAIYLLHEAFNDLVVKALFDKANAAILQWIGDGLRAAWPLMLAPYLAHLQSLALAVAAFAIVWFVARRSAWPRSHSEAGQPYWTLTETVTWIACGEAVKSGGLNPNYMARVGVPDGSAMLFLLAGEAILFEALGDPDNGADIKGREFGKGEHKTIPHSVFLGKVGANVFNNSIGKPFGADLETIMDTTTREWGEVRLRRAHIVDRWPRGGLRHLLSGEERRILPGLKDAARLLRDTLTEQSSYTEAVAVYRPVEQIIESARSMLGLGPLADALRDGARRILGNAREMERTTDEDFRQYVQETRLRMVVAAEGILSV